MTHDIQLVAMARNGALWEAGWGDDRNGPGVTMPHCETREGRHSATARKEAIGGNPIYFTPADRAMVFCILAKPYEDQKPRPWRILVGTETATDKRGRVRQWASSQAAMAEARRIERDALGVPRRARVGTKKVVEPPPAPLLELMQSEPRPFKRGMADFVAQRVGTTKWFVGPRLTQNMRNKGYERAIPQKAFTAMQEEFEAMP